jgi:hypothetical protein
MDEYRSVAVSPVHSVSVSPDYFVFIERAPRRDYVVRTLAKKQAGNTLLMTGDLVIAGAEAREQFPLAAEYPLHFRKAYYPGSFHRDPKDEFENHARASELIGVPRPIGHTPNTFRSCLIPGDAYSRLSPLGVDPEESNIALAQKLAIPAAAGLWLLASRAFERLKALHAGGMVHGDAELHNLIVCPSPLDVIPIDFEVSAMSDGKSAEDWASRCAADVLPLLREAIFLQCCLGRQRGEFADLAFSRMDQVLKSAERFRRAIDGRSRPSAQ